MDAHIDKALKQKYSSALMSNHKWHKFFKVLENLSSRLSNIEFRFTDTANILFRDSSSIGHIWLDTYDDALCGPIEFKHIESIFIPKTYSFIKYENGPQITKTQDIEVLLKELEKVGKFPIRPVDSGIFVDGYVK